MKAKNRGVPLTGLVYIVTRSGEGLNTKYDIDAIEPAKPATPPQNTAPDPLVQKYNDTFSSFDVQNKEKLPF